MSTNPARRAIAWMRRTLALAGAIAALSAGPAWSDTLAVARAQGTLKVCIWPQYYGISFRDERDGTLRGIDIDLARQLGADLGLPVAFTDSDFTRFMDDLDQGRCAVAMFAVGVTAQRAQRVAFTKPYLRSGVYAIATKVGTRVRTWADLDRSGVVVAVPAGTFLEPLMKAELKQAEIMLVRPPATREDEVLSGRADVFVTDYPYSRRMLAQHDWARVIEPTTPVGLTDYAYAVRRGDDEWLRTVDAFVARIRADARLLAAARANGLEAIAVRD